MQNFVKVYTLNGTYAFFDEDKLGLIMRGKLADLVVLNRDLTAIPKEEIGDILVELAMADGRVVCQRD